MEEKFYTIFTKELKEQFIIGKTYRGNFNVFSLNEIFVNYHKGDYLIELGLINKTDLKTKTKKVKILNIVYLYSLETYNWLMSRSVKLKAYKNIFAYKFIENNSLNDIMHLFDNEYLNVNDTYLCEAAENNRLDVIKYLLETDFDECDFNIADLEDNILRIAIKNKNEILVKYLINAGLDILSDYESLLIYAYENFDINIVKYLIEEKKCMDICINASENVAMLFNDNELKDYINYLKL